MPAASVAKKFRNKRDACANMLSMVAYS